MTRSAASLVAVVAAAVVLLVLVGRWERTRHIEAEERGMRTVLAEIGPLDNRTLSMFRYLPEFQCLLYARGGDEVALEVCVDAGGRVVEAIDRLGGRSRIWSLREDPHRSSVRVDRALFDRLLLRLDLPERYVRLAHEHGG